MASNLNSLTQQFSEPFVERRLSEVEIQDLMFSTLEESAATIASDLGHATTLVQTLAGVLRWALGSRFGHLNYVKRQDQQKLPPKRYRADPGAYGKGV